MHKILVTGGAGFIGSNLVRMLLEQGHDVSVIDNFITSPRSYIKSMDVQLFEADILDLERVRNAVKGHDMVFHLAAFGNVIESVQNPCLNFDVNAKGTLNILEACRLESIEKLIFSSTGGALMGNAELPVTEKSLPNPISPYGASKLAAEGYISAYSACYGISSIIFRFANVFGPNSAHKKGVINKFIKNINSKEPIVIFGKSARDFIYVEDIVRGLMSGITFQNKESTPAIFHLSSNKILKIESLAKKIAAIINIPVDIEYAPARAGEVIENFACFDKARQQLSFKPLTSIDDGLKKTIEWLLNNENNIFNS